MGIFPDAFDCRKFHLCSPPEGLPDGRPADHRAALCPRHYGYSPQTAQCSVSFLWQSYHDRYCLPNFLAICIVCDHNYDQQSNRKCKTNGGSDFYKL